MLAMESTYMMEGVCAQLSSCPPPPMPKLTRRWSAHDTPTAAAAAAAAASTANTTSAIAAPVSVSLSSTPAPSLATKPELEVETAADTIVKTVVAEDECKPVRQRRGRRHSVDMDVLPSSLKKAAATSALTSKLVQYVDALRHRDHRHHHHHHQHPHHRTHRHVPTFDPHQRRKCHVHFPDAEEQLHQALERPPITESEKTLYHYSHQELVNMVVDAKAALVRETSRFGDQPEHTVFAQGFLTLPNEHHFFHHRRYYCLLKLRSLLCYSSPEHAAKGENIKCRMAIIKVQDCATLSDHAKITAFGATLPTNMPLLFFVTKANGERVLLQAESKNAKKNWVRTLAQLTRVYEAPPPMSLPLTKTTSSSSTASTATCASDDDDGDRILDEMDTSRVASPVGVVEGASPSA